MYVDTIKDIYNICPLTYPKAFQCDNGSEFKGGEPTKCGHSPTALGILIVFFIIGFMS